MDVDVTSEISAVERQVGRRALAPGEARVVVLTRRFAAEVAEVWDACTTPERIGRWFLPISVSGLRSGEGSGELRPGARYQLEGNAGGTVETCDPPTRFSATWEYGGNLSWIEVELSPVAHGTELRLEHVAHVDEEFWDTYGPGATGVGWELGLLGLARHLAAPGVPVDQAAGAAWPTTPDGTRFATMSSERWGEASIAAGTDPQAARAAADRTTDFYTVAPEPSDA